RAADGLHPRRGLLPDRDRAGVGARGRPARQPAERPPQPPRARGRRAVSAGYSGTPLAKKLGCKADGRLLTRDAPAAFAVPDLPEGCVRAALEPGGTAGEPGDVVVAFFAARSALAAALATLGEAIFPAGALWVAWPRRAAGHDSDIREQDIRDLALRPAALRACGRRRAAAPRRARGRPDRQHRGLAAARADRARAR